MNGIIDRIKPFCADCDNLQLNGKLPRACQSCPKIMKMHSDHQLLIDKYTEALLEYEADRDKITEMYNDLMEDRNKIMAEKKSCMKRQLEILIKYKKLVKEKKNE